MKTEISVNFKMAVAKLYTDGEKRCTHYKGHRFLQNEKLAHQICSLSIDVSSVLLLIEPPQFNIRLTRSISIGKYDVFSSEKLHL